MGRRRACSVRLLLQGLGTRCLKRRRLPTALPPADIAPSLSLPNRSTREEAKRRAVVLAPAISQWVKGCGAADVAVGGIAWRKVLQPGKKVRAAGCWSCWGVEGWVRRAGARALACA